MPEKPQEDRIRKFFIVSFVIFVIVILLAFAYTSSSLNWFSKPPEKKAVIQVENYYYSRIHIGGLVGQADIWRYTYHANVTNIGNMAGNGTIHFQATCHFVESWSFPDGPIMAAHQYTDEKIVEVIPGEIKMVQGSIDIPFNEVTWTNMPYGSLTFGCWATQGP